MTNYKLATETWGDEELDAIQKVIEKGIYSMSDHVAQYESDFADFFGSKYSIMVNSGSSANLLMVAAMFFLKDESRRLKRGDEIIVPAVSWSTTYFPLQQYGLKVKFVDVDSRTLNIDLEKLKAAISDDTRAILAVNLLGNPNDFSKIKKMIAGRNITLLEDNCESMGATYGGRQAGTFGLMGTFSSFFSHHIATMEGGCIVTDDEEIYHILLSIRAHGWTRNLPKFNHVTGQKSDNQFEESFKFVLPGYNLRPLEMSGAIGIEQLKKLPDFIVQRRLNAQIFKDSFAHHDSILTQLEIGESSWFGFSMIVSETSPFTRKELINILDQNGVECRPIVTGNFLKNSDVLKFFDYEIHGSLHSAEIVEANGLFVGNQQKDISESIIKLSEIIPKGN